ncbi:hypothetical protein [Methylobacterium nigriterrae]|uniref:hypothetical protein n=1 Tax=Methylobacterium nigriterrae TaxID=3127512 RepID=UPI0030136E39
MSFIVRAIRAELTVMNGCTCASAALRLVAERRATGFQEVQVRAPDGRPLDEALLRAMVGFSEPPLAEAAVRGSGGRLVLRV